MSDIPSRDDLAKDLDKMFTDCIVADPDGNLRPDRNKLMQSLVMYIVRRDHLVHDAGIEVGKKLANGNLEPEEEQ